MQLGNVRKSATYNDSFSIRYRIVGDATVQGQVIRIITPHFQYPLSDRR